MNHEITISDININNPVVDWNTRVTEASEKLEPALTQGVADKKITSAQAHGTTRGFVQESL